MNQENSQDSLRVQQIVCSSWVLKFPIVIVVFFGNVEFAQNKLKLYVG